MKNIWVNGMMGLVVGDAIGMPVQFKDRAILKANPVKIMQGYGTYHMPPGTWSDDTSMALATLASIREKEKIDYSDIMERFVKWNYWGEYTPYGQAFDQGNTCMEAIDNYVKDKDYKTCGKTGERANGNGALMRIMPICLYAYEKVQQKKWELSQALESVHQVSALTHNHLRSKIACGIYYFMIQNIIDGCGTLMERLQMGVDNAVKFYHGDMANDAELAYYKRLFHLEEFAKCSEDEIKSSGYVVDTLEAAVWSLITTDNLEDALLKAVNLGDDTDTVGAVIGGLAGLYYGYESAPEEWKRQIVKKEEIIALCKMDETISYYNQNAEAFTESTINVDFVAMQDKFLNKLNKESYILDFGCGSGRDAKYFLEQGYLVDAIDGSAELCKLASNYAGIAVKHMLFQDLQEVDKYDAIWACSSILHLPYEELVAVMKKMVIALKENGLIYTSFKYGTFAGVRNRRYFIDMTEDTLMELLQEVGGLELEELWITSDVRPGRGEEKWLNLFLRKK